LADFYFRSRYPEEDFPYQVINEKECSQKLALAIEALDNVFEQISEQKDIEKEPLAKKCLSLLPEDLARSTEVLIFDKLSL